MSDAVIARLRYWLEHGQTVKPQLSTSDVRAIIEAHDSRAAPKDERHPESYCHRCGNPNVVWFAPNDIWNRVMPDDGIVCPVCFVLAAESAGIVPTGWALLPEDRLATVAALTAENERLTRINAELCDALDPVGRIERALEAESAALPSSRETTDG